MTDKYADAQIDRLVYELYGLTEEEKREIASYLAMTNKCADAQIDRLVYELYGLTRRCSTSPALNPKAVRVVRTIFVMVLKLRIAGVGRFPTSREFVVPF